MTSQLSSALETAGVPCAPVQDIEQVSSHPQTQAIGIKRGGENLEFFGLPLRFDRARPDRDEPAPALGQDNAWLEDLLSREA